MNALFWQPSVNQSGIDYRIHILDSGMNQGTVKPYDNRSALSPQDRKQNVDAAWAFEVLLFCTDLQNQA